MHSVGQLSFRTISRGGQVRRHILLRSQFHSSSAKMTLDVPVPGGLLGSISAKVPKKLLMGPGPSNAPQRVLDAGSLPILGHLHREFTDIMDDIKTGSRYLFQTRNEVTLVISGTGHAAMEAVMSNALERGETVLIACQGIWGERATDMAERQGVVVKKLVKQPGEVLTPAELEAALVQHKPRAFFVVHSESSAGFMQPIDGFGEVCHKYDALLLVDTVASLGGTPFYADRLGVDVCYTGPQKVLGCPPPGCPITFSERAMDRIKNRKTKPTSYYFDVTLLADYWGIAGYQKGPGRLYHHTAPVTSFYQLREAMSILAKEGLEACWARHSKIAELLHDGITGMGLELFVENPEHRLPCVTAVRIPDGVDWKGVVETMMKNNQIEISGGLGPTVGKVWRIGTMGVNANEEDTVATLQSFSRALKANGYEG